MLNKRGIVALFVSVLLFCGGVQLNAMEFMSNENISLLGEFYKENTNKVYINDIEVERKMISQHYVKRGTDPKYIVIHDTDNRDPGADVYMTQKYFNTTTREASAHYAVQDDAIVQMVEDTDTAWHAGDRYNPVIQNSNSIGIEINVHPESDFNVAMDNAMELTKHLMEKYDIPADNVVRHYDVTGKTCPRMMIEDDPTLWTKFKAGIGDEKAIKQLAEDAKEELSNSRLITKTVDLQDEPSWIYTTLTELKAGTMVEFVKEEDSWVNVRSGNYEGWVSNLYVEDNIKSKKQKVKEVAVMSLANTSGSPSLGVIGAGEEVDVYHVENGWAHVSFDKKFGYIPSDVLEDTK